MSTQGEGGREIAPNAAVKAHASLDNSGSPASHGLWPRVLQNCLVSSMRLLLCIFCAVVFSFGGGCCFYMSDLILSALCRFRIPKSLCSSDSLVTPYLPQHCKMVFLFFSPPFLKFLLGLPWWLRGKEFACQWRRCGFDPWPGRIAHAVEPVLHNY